VEDSVSRKPKEWKRRRTAMSKRVLLCPAAMLVLTLGMSGCVTPPPEKPPGVPEEELAWWPSKAMPAPKADPVRPGYWWWPTEAGEEKEVLWGNRGYVYVLRGEGDELGPEGLPAPPVPGPGEIKVEQIPVGVKDVAQLVLEDWVHFEFDKYDLTPLGMETLDKAAQQLEKHTDVKVILEGHACSCGPERYNLTLGMNRAKAVKDYLVQKGIAPSRLTAVSYGELRPAVVERNKADHAKNRRVEFNVRPPEESEAPPSPEAAGPEAESPLGC
jgi:peptidoglycan-associated lipoprotein